MRAVLSVYTVAALAAFTACGASETASQDQPPSSAATSLSPSPTAVSSPPVDEPAVTPDAEYGTVEDLRDAAVAAGYFCKNWKTDNVISLAASSGHCSGGDVFSVYATESDRDEQVASQRSFSEDFDVPFEVLVGPNWIINADRMTDEVADALGGVPISS